MIIDRKYTWSTMGTGEVAPGETHCLLRSWYSTRLHPYLHFHGVGDVEPADQFLTSPICTKYHAPILRGIPCYAGLWGGASTFGNAAFQSSMVPHLNWLDARGLDTTRIGVTGTSHGALNACLFAALIDLYFPGRIACINLMVPLLDLRFARDTNVFGLATLAESCWGGTAGFEQNCDRVSPLTFAASLAHIPIRVYYSTTDPLYTQAQVDAFCAAAGVQPADKIPIGAIGHSIVSDAIDEQDLAAWIDRWM